VPSLDSDDDKPCQCSELIYISRFLPSEDVTVSINAPCALYVVMAVFEIRTLSKLESTRVAQCSTDSVRCEARTSVSSLMIVTTRQHTYANISLKSWTHSRVPTDLPRSSS
jgi:hypothetical protein